MVVRYEYMMMQMFSKQRQMPAAAVLYCRDSAEQRAHLKYGAEQEDTHGGDFTRCGGGRGGRERELMLSHLRCRWIPCPRTPLDAIVTAVTRKHVGIQKQRD